MRVVESKSMPLYHKRMQQMYSYPVPTRFLDLSAIFLWKLSFERSRKEKGAVRQKVFRKDGNFTLKCCAQMQDILFATLACALLPCM